MATIGQQLTVPEAGWKRYDDTDGAIVYVGTVGRGGASGVNYNGTQTYVSAYGDKIKFNFLGTKFRLIIYRYTNRCDNVEIVVDGGVPETFSEYGSDQTFTLVYEKTGLSNSVHTVEMTNKFLTSDKNVMILDAIDIDDTGRLLHPEEVTSISELVVGSRIRCHYSAGSDSYGAFYGLGEEISDFIPATGTTTPNGDFYFICVDTDNRGRWKLIADRNVQYGISWNSLNSEGIASGGGLELGEYSSSIIPKMTSNTAPSGIASASSVYSISYDAWKAFNKSFGATVVEDTWETSGNAVPAWLAYEFPYPVVVNAYAITTLNSSDRTPKNWTFEGSNDGGKTWVILDTQVNQTGWIGNEKRTFVFDNKTAYKKYRVHITANNGGIYHLVNELEMMTKYEEGVNYTVRLLSGGVSSSDADNEWNKYIVNSTLNGTIAAGDDNVWHWKGVWSLTSTTPSGMTDKRAVRGYNSVSGYSSVLTSDTTAVNSGFRPVLVIEIFNRYLVLDSSEYKTLKADNWVSVGSILTVDLFLQEGMYDIRRVFTPASKTVSAVQSMTYDSALGGGHVYKTSVSLETFLSVDGIDVSSESTVKKFLARVGGVLKKYSAGAWVDLGTALSESLFLTDGMDSINTIPGNAWFSSFELLQYSDVVLNVPPAVSITGTKSIAPFDELSSQPSIVYWTPALKDKSTATVIVTPLPKVIIPKGDIALSGAERIEYFDVVATTSESGIIKVVASTDSGATWKSYKSGSWVSVDVNNLQNFKEYGMTPQELRALTSDIWALLMPSPKFIRFAYYLELEHFTDTASVDKLVSMIDMNGRWRAQVLGTHYDVEYVSNNVMRIYLYQDGSYKINY